MQSPSSQTHYYILHFIGTTNLTDFNNRCLFTANISQVKKVQDMVLISEKIISSSFEKIVYKLTHFPPSIVNINVGSVPLH